MSIVVVTYDNLPFNRICLESLLTNTNWQDYEIIVVDNGSQDGTREYLETLARANPQVHVIYNDLNNGFGPAINRGLEEADGSLLVIMNNDTLVPPAWLPSLVKHLDGPNVGMIGPVTNRTGNEAQIQTSYETYGEFVDFAEERCRTHSGESFEIGMLTMFCVAMRRDVYQQIGPLDERFETGFFEDDDYAMRVRASGYRILCAEDTFVHHFAGASFSKLAAAGKYGELFHGNRRRWEEKWGRPWQPHTFRRDALYEELVHQIRRVMEEVLPEGSTVAVVSKGDETFLQVSRINVHHFPQTAEGEYAGHYPADSAEAIGLLEAARRNGIQFLLFPNTAMWWLEHYRGFNDYLQTVCRVVEAEPRKCLIFDIR